MQKFISRLVKPALLNAGHALNERQKILSLFFLQLSIGALLLCCEHSYGEPRCVAFKYSQFHIDGLQQEGSIGTVSLESISPNFHASCGSREIDKLSNAKLEFYRHEDQFPIYSDRIYINTAQIEESFDSNQPIKLNRYSHATSLSIQILLPKALFKFRDDFTVKLVDSLSNTILAMGVINIHDSKGQLNQH